MAYAYIKIPMEKASFSQIFQFSHFSFRKNLIRNITKIFFF